MPITLAKDVVAEIIRCALNGRDYRDIVDVVSTNAVLNFFQEVGYAKLRENRITLDWYQNQLSNIDANDTGKHESSNTQLDIYRSSELDNEPLELIRSFEEEDTGFDISLKFGDVSIRLDLNESLVVINGLMAQRIGVWNAASKQVKCPLMETLCRLFEVESRFYDRALADDDSLREVDYYLLPPHRDRAKCEVKLMGRGNPESADVIHARDTDVFIASTLSDTNRRQLNDAGVFWTELQVSKGFLRFQKTLYELGIPHAARDSFSDADIESAIRQTLAL